MVMSWPLVIGMAFTRLLDSPELAAEQVSSASSAVAIDASGERQQRIVVVGDSDFMLNAFIGKGVNLDLATNLFNWLADDDDLLNIRNIAAPDTRLELDERVSLTLAVFFLLVLPLGLILTGVVVWVRRRRR